jgi:hypothetical protein
MKVKELLQREDELRSRWRFADTNELEHRMKVYEEWKQFLEREVELK